MIKKRKKDKPEPGKQYALTGGSKDKCIMNGNTWAESEVKSIKKGQNVNSPR